MVFQCLLYGDIYIYIRVCPIHCYVNKCVHVIFFSEIHNCIYDLVKYLIGFVR